MSNSDLIQFVKLVPFLGKVMGRHYEIILFDVLDYSLPIIDSSNIKDSSVEKAREFVRKVMDLPDIETRDYWVNYPMVLHFEKMSKMSVYLIRNEEHKVCSALVICMRCEDFFKMESFLSSILEFNNVDLGEENVELPRNTEKQTDRDLSLDTITEYIKEFGVDPDRTNHDEKSEIICDLYDMGVYNLKGAVAKTAEELGISTKSVYRYLSKLKKARE